jgi:hypothetical protein
MQFILWFFEGISLIKNNKKSSFISQSVLCFVFSSLLCEKAAAAGFNNLNVEEELNKKGVFPHPFTIFVIKIKGLC